MDVLILIILTIYLLAGADVLLGMRRLKFLKEIPLLGGEGLPSITLIIAARNELKNIEMALESLLKQDYPNLDLIVFDDRSTDGTSEILDRMAKRYVNMKVVHIKELPDGWLGKNFSLYSGAQMATGEYILFSDADVVMRVSAVRRAMGYMMINRLDHLTVFPELKLRGWLLNMAVGAFSIIFGIYTRPWKAKDPKSHSHIGIGAFNLVRREAYRIAGTHKRIAMRPDDDMKLAKMIKKAGFRQDCLLGRGMIFVEWYQSFSELIHGLEKNAFASVNYNLFAVMMATAANFLIFFTPLAGIFLSSGAYQIVSLFILVIISIFYYENAKMQGLNPWYGLGFPLSNLILIYIIWNSTVKTLFRNGIDWRDTHYPLEKLKANKV